MNNKKKKKNNLLDKALIFLCTVLFFVAIGVYTPAYKTLVKYLKGFSAVNETPAHEKNVTANGDGTYKLSLTVTGDSERKDTNTKANVVIVLDVSGSMDFAANTSSRYQTNSGKYCYVGTNDYRRVFYLRDGKYYPEGTGPDTSTHTTVYYKYDRNDNGSLHWRTCSGGNRYSYGDNTAARNASRMEQTQTAVKNLVSTLLAQNNNTNDMIEISLVTFSTRAHYTSPTSATGTGWTKGTDATALNNTIDGIYAEGATNWDEALRYAKTLADAKNDGDKTYVVFFSDGEPTTYGTGGNDNSYNYTTSRSRANTAADALNGTNYDLYGIFAYGNTTGQGYMRTLVSHGNYGNGNHNTGNVGGFYFSANSQDEINAAFNQIASSISSAVGVGNASIDDGTTSSIVVKSGNMDAEGLIEVDENSYEYWMYIPVTANGSNYKFDKFVSYQGIGQQTFNVALSGTETDGLRDVTISWGTKTAQYKGNIVTKNGKQQLKIKWGDKDSTPATSFYGSAPQASFNEDHVVWDLGNDVLLNEVTYEVTFDVWPTQTALDLVADQKNNGRNAIPDKAKPYITEDGKIRTNTGATLTWDDTREGGNTKNSEEYTDPEPVSTDTVEMLSFTKKWSDDKHTDKMDLYVNRDSESEYYTVPLEAPDWEHNVYISIGILRVDKSTNANTSVEVLSKGHDYSFAEPKGLAWNWEFNAPTVHPMQINGTTTLLEKVDKPAGMGSNTYYKDGSDEYYIIDGNCYKTTKNNTASLTAENVRKSVLNINKTLTGEDADHDTLFTYDIDIDTKNPNEKEIWFSVGDEDTYYKVGDEEFVTFIVNSSETYVTGAQLEMKSVGQDGYSSAAYDSETGIITYVKNGRTDKVYVGPGYNFSNTSFPTGYYYTSNPAHLTVKIKDNWNIRFINVPTGSEYTIVESNDGGANYVLDDLTASVKDNETEATTSTGTVDKANAKVKITVEGGASTYNADFTNKCIKTHLDVYKDWQDTDNQDGIRPDKVTFKLTNDKNDTTQEFEVDGKADTEDYCAANNNCEKEAWVAHFDNLPLYDDDNNEITYAVEEVKTNVLTGEDGPGTYKVYDAVWNESKERFEIKNEHTPETIDLEVKKVWEDNNNQDNLRPTSVVFTLFAGETSTGKTATLTQKDNPNTWSYTFEDLDKYADGKEIDYSVKELVSVANYDDPKTSKDGLTITNTHNPYTAKIKITKTWDDKGDQDRKRKDANATVQLYANGQPAKDQDGNTIAAISIPTNNDTWETTIENLPVNNTNPITYTAIETVTGYTQKIVYNNNENATNVTLTKDETSVIAITNSYTPEETSATVIKNWDDAGDQDGIRPTELNVLLTGTNGVTKPATLTAKDGWTTTISGLPKYKDGVEVEYTWTEAENTLPEGYTLTGNETEKGVTTLTNSYTPETTNITITKIWEDDDDNDGFRPDSITVYLVDGINDPRPVTLTADDWTTTIRDLPVNHAGEEITYSVTEDQLDGYLEPVPVASADGNKYNLKIKNEREVKYTKLKVTKTWDDENDQDGQRANANATIQLYKQIEGGSKVAVGDPIPVGTEDNWSTEWAKLSIYEDGKVITYSVEETLGSTDYKKSGDDVTRQAQESNDPAVTITDSGEIAITNKYVPKTEEITVTKKWEDNKDQDGKRPDKVNFTVTGTDNKTYPVELTGDKGAEEWTAKVTVDKYYNHGQEVEFTVDEDSVPTGYTKVTPIDQENLTITNKIAPQQKEITVTKVWEDASNQDGIRPNKVGFTVTGTDGKTYDVELTTENAVSGNANKWQKTIKVDELYNHGQNVEFTVDEDTTNFPEGYTKGEVDQDNLTITNKYTPDETTVTVEKDWADNKDQDGYRSTAGATVQLYKLVDGVSEKVGDPINVGTTENWSKTIENLPVKESGKTIKYYFVETLSGENATKYEKSGDGEATAVTAQEGNSGTIKITNTHKADTKKIKVSKVWDDDSNRDKKRPEDVDFTVTGNEDNKTYPVTLKTSDATEDDANKWTVEVEVEKYYNQGKEVTFKVAEDVVPTGYTLGTVDQANLTITNKYTPEVTSSTVIKIWDDASDQDAIRPKTLKVTLSNGQEVVLTAENAMPSDKNKWTTTVNNLPKNDQGVEIHYSWTEESVGNNEKEGYKLVSESTTNNVTTLTNKHIPFTVDVKAKKVWDDNNNQDGKRPKQIEFKLNGEKSIILDGTPDNNGEDEAWLAVFKDLPMKKNGQVITYTVEEVKTSVLTGDDTEETYAIKTEGDQFDGYKITNTHTPTKISIAGEKIWDDDNNRDGIRPGSVTVTLKANGETAKHYDGSPVENITVTSKDAVSGKPNNWKYEFTDLPKYKDGKEIKYTVEETVVPEGYEQGSVEENEYSIRNSHTSLTTSVKGKKTWSDGDDQDGKRPDSITVTLYAGDEIAKGFDGKQIDPITVTGPNWEYEFTNLPRKADGQLITYTVKEDDVKDYSVKYTGKDNMDTNIQTLNITNTHTPETLDINGEKVWDDEDNQDGLRDTITINLKKNGEVFKSTTASEESGWKYSFTGLPRYEKGELVEYEIEEITVDGYTTVIDPMVITTEGEADAPESHTIINITNHHTPATVSFSGTKVWDDNDNNDGKRPDSITVKVIRVNADKTETVLDTYEVKGPDWTYTTKNYPKYNKGIEIQYRIDEEPVKSYEATITTGETVTTVKPDDETALHDNTDVTITNKHENEQQTITVKKVWDDQNNKDGLRPTSVVVQLLADGEVIDTVTLNAANNWSYSWTKDKYKAGKVITYTVNEATKINGYKAIYSGNQDSGYKITNYHKVTSNEVPPHTSVNYHQEYNDIFMLILLAVFGVIGIEGYLRKEGLI